MSKRAYDGGGDDKEKATSRLFEIQCEDAKRANIKPKFNAINS
jgi:hypothetical protein